MMLKIVALVGMLSGTILCGETMQHTLKVTSSAFKEEQSIPKKYTCDGQNTNPPLAWQGAPAETKSFVIICEDPDAPKGIFVHWVLFNLSHEVTSLDEGFDVTEYPPAVEGWTSFEKPVFGGPCPPSGTHRYFFTVYAVEVQELSLNGKKLTSTATATDVRDAIKGHILAQGRLMGTFARAK